MSACLVSMALKPIDAYAAINRQAQEELALDRFVDRYGMSDTDEDVAIPKKHGNAGGGGGDSLGGGGFGQMMLNKKFVSGAKTRPLVAGRRVGDPEGDMLRKAKEFRMNPDEFKALPRNGDFTVFTVPKDVKAKANKANWN